MSSRYTSVDLGPHKINGVPLRRVNQAYVIATSTSVSVAGVATDKYVDEYFVAKKDAKKGKTAAELFGEGSVKVIQWR